MTLSEAFEHWRYAAPVEDIAGTSRPVPIPEGIAFLDEETAAEEDERGLHQ